MVVFGGWAAVDRGSRAHGASGGGLGGSEAGEIVVSLDSKRLMVLAVLVLVSVATVYSYVAALFAFIAPSGDLPLRVTNVSTFDTDNNGKTTFARGEVVRINATVEMAEGYYYDTSVYYYPYFDSVETTYRIVIAVMDDDGRPVGFYSQYPETITPGESLMTTFDCSVPSGASTGTYVIRVLVWSGWLPGGDALAPTAGEASFEVT